MDVELTGTCVFGPLNLAPASARAESYALYGGGTCGRPLGHVFVTNDLDFLYVTWVVRADGWQIAEAHVHVALSLEGIPQKDGDPAMDQFEYRSSYDPMMAREYSYAIPLAWDVDTEPLIAAHASVVKVDEHGNVVQQETCWPEGYEFPGKSRARYIKYTVQRVVDDVPDGVVCRTQSMGA